MYGERKGRMSRKARQRVIAGISLLAMVLLLSGCSLLFGGRQAEEPTIEDEERVVVPTFTPTPELPPTATPVPEVDEPQVVEVAPSAAEANPPADAQAITETNTETNTEAITDTSTASTTTDSTTTDSTTSDAAPTPTPMAKVVVNAAQVNARSGPGTEYGLSGSLTQGQAFDVVGKNADGTWWQFCCVNGQQAWVFGELVNVENAEAVPVAQNLPPTPAPVAAAPQPTAPQPSAPEPTAAPAEPAAPPTNTPEAAPPPPAGAVNAGDCGGDDGCKFRVTGGPTTAPNGGFELKFQLFFMHSGVDGGQPQGDYRLGIEKDGQLIGIFADTTSFALSKNEGPMGPYNYEAKIGAGDLPGGTLEGNYSFWVLDGNRQRDSDVYPLFIPGDQGEVWIQFDQG